MAEARNLFCINMHKKNSLSKITESFLWAANDFDGQGIKLLTFSYMKHVEFKVFRGLSFFYYTQQKLIVMPQIILLPGADHAPQITFNTAAVLAINSTGRQPLSWWAIKTGNPYTTGRRFCNLQQNFLICRRRKKIRGMKVSFC